MNSKKILPPTFLMAAFIAMFALHFIAPLAMIVPGYWRLIGLLPLIVGVAVDIIADRAFQRARTTIKPFEESSALVVDGFYAFSRNPMYLGFVLMLFGSAILLGSLSPWLVMAVFAVLMDCIYIAVEERMLLQTFGPAFDAYKQKTRRWL